MNEMTVLCKAEEVEAGKPVAVNVEPFAPLAVFLHEGNYYVTDNTCTHGMAMLTEGYQDDHEIECPFHGGAFDITNGEAVSFPCQLPLKTYPVTVADGDISIPTASANEQ